MIAICLLTCDRGEYTAQTLASLAHHTNLYGADLLLLHADDGSILTYNRVRAGTCGFRTVWAPPVRQGVIPALRALWSAAAEAGAEYILHLENDWEFVAPLPAMKGVVDCVRLYGTQKARSGPRRFTGTHRIGTQEPIRWVSVSDGWEYGRAHWGGPPSITRTELLLPAVREAATLKDISLALNALPTLRPVENIVWHIGEESTPLQEERAC